MSDPRCYGHWAQSTRNSSFYHQYLQHHSRMTQWMQSFHRNLPTPKHSNYPYHYNGHNNKGASQPENNNAHIGLLAIKHCPLPGSSRMGQPSMGGHVSQNLSNGNPSTRMNWDGNMMDDYASYCMKKRSEAQIDYLKYELLNAQRFKPSMYNPETVHAFKNTTDGYYPYHQKYNPLPRKDVNTSPLSYVQQRLAARYSEHVEQISHEDPTEDSIESEDDEEISDDSSVTEVEFNVDAIIAMRATREERDKDEEDSFELIDALVDENFEYVEMDAYGKCQRRFGNKPPPVLNAYRDLEDEREMRKLLYGERANTIAGLETAMAVTFDHLSDIHQHNLWPVLPIDM